MKGIRVDRLLATAFVASFIMLAFEVLAYRQLTLVASALQTSTIISVAIMGIAGGGWLFHVTREWPVEHAIRRAAWALAASVFASFAAFPVLGEHLPKAVPLLCSPFIAGGYVVSLVFAHRPVRTAYLVDLCGGALAIPVVVALLPWVREEGAHFFLAAIALMLPVIASSESRWCRVLTVGGATALFAAGAVNASIDFYNLTRDSVATNLSSARALNRAKLPRRTVIASKSTIAGRTDVIQVSGDGGGWAALFENGRQIDLLRRHTSDHYIWDPRVPRGVLPADPRVFVIGTAGEGILKTLTALGAHIDGVELNAGVYELLTGPLAPLCANCYDGVNASITDGRTYLERSDQRFDMITLLNAHVVEGYESPAVPEFIHTKEAIALYFERLREGGFVNWEERQTGDADSRAGRAAFRVVATAAAVLRDRGVEDPGRHIVAFRWNSGGNYDQILVRPEPWDVESLAAVRTWLEQVRRARGSEYAPFNLSEVRPLWFPDEELSNPLAVYMREGEPPAHMDSLATVPLTDDKPFTFHYRPGDERVWQAFLWVLLAALPLVLLPAVSLLIGKRERPVAGRLVAPFLIAAILGVAYLLIEIVLMQHLQIFLGSPSATFCAVLAGMLAFSGIGGFIGASAGAGIRVVLFIALPISLGALAALLPALTQIALPWPLVSRVLVVLALIGVPAFLMGIPLPSLLMGVKARVGTRYVPLLFAVNAGFAALGTTLSFIVSTAYGFSATYWLACGIYFALVAPLIALDRDQRFAAQ